MSWFVKAQLKAPNAPEWPKTFGTIQFSAQDSVIRVAKSPHTWRQVSRTSSQQLAREEVELSDACSQNYP